MRKNGAFLCLSSATAVLWLGIVVCVMSGHPGIFPDTPSYEVNQVGRIAFAGDATRAWPVPLVFALSSSYRIQALLQAAVYGAGWTAVIWAFMPRWRTKVCAVASAGIVLLALSPLYLQWTLTVLSEAITLGFLLLGVAGAQAVFVRLERGGRATPTTWLLVAGTIAALGMAAMNRLPLLVIMLAVCAVVLVRAWRFRVQAVAVAMAISVLLMSAYVAWLNGRINETWMPLSRPGTYYGYLTATSDEAQENKLADQLHAYMATRVPACLPPIRAAAKADPGNLGSTITSKCPEAVEWLRQEFTGEYLKFVVTHPSYTAAYFIDLLPKVGYRGRRTTGYVAVNSILPAPLAGLFVTVREDKASQQGDHDAYVPIILWTFVGFAAATMELLGRRRGNAQAAPNAVAIAAMAASPIALLATLLTLNSETARITSQSSALLLASVILVSGGLADRLFTSRSAAES